MTKLIRALLALFLIPVVAVGAVIASDVQPAFAAGARVQAEACGGLAGSNFTSCSFTSYGTAGNLLVVYAAWDDTSTASADDNQQSGCLVAASSADAFGGFGTPYRQKVWYCPNMPANLFTARVTFSGTPSNAHVIIAEYSGIATSSALGQVVHTNPQTDSGAGPAVSTITKTVSTDTVVWFFSESTNYTLTQCGNYGENRPAFVTISDAWSASCAADSVSTGTSRSATAGVYPHAGVPFGVYAVTFHV